MYCTDFVCTYHLYGTDDDNDHEQDDEDIYRSQFLQAFELEEWDDDIINKKTLELFNKIRENKDCKAIFDKIFEKVKRHKDNMFYIMMIGDDDLVMFKLLFKFELFHITHSILCSYLNNNIITEDADKLYP
jgi:hypothetical protein